MRSEIVSKKNQAIVLFILFLIYSEIVKIWAHLGNKRFRTKKNVTTQLCLSKLKLHKVFDCLNVPCVGLHFLWIFFLYIKTVSVQGGISKEIIGCIHIRKV